MAEFDQAVLNEIAELLTRSWKNQLEIPRLSTRYGGPGIPGAPKRGTSPPIASGNLIRNIEAKFVMNEATGFPELVMEMPIEGEFVAEGRRPGRYPPIAPIDKWVVQKKGITGARDLKGKFIKRKSLVYLIRRSIGLYGYGGNNFILKGYEEVAPQIFDLYGDAVAGYIQFQLDLFIEKLRKEK
jgi:hypothetical protein